MDSSEITKSDIAYAAGIIDGEGCISISKGPSYRCRVRVANTDLRLVNWLQKTFGGYANNSAEVRGNRRNQFEWALNDNAAVEFLHMIKSHLKLKREQAELLIEARSTYGGYYRLTGVPKEILNKRELCYQKCKDLKKVEFSKL